MRVPDGTPSGVALSAVARVHGGILAASPEDARLFHLPGGRAFRVELDSRRVELDGVWIWLSVPVSRTNGVWRLNRTDIERIVNPLIRPGPYLAAGGGDLARVVLDPGHGGIDSGAVSSSGLEEKTLTLKIARRVRDRLKAAGVRAILTREDDVFVSLEERSRIAAEAQPSVFVSIHLNAASSPGAQGVETYVLTCAGCASTNARDLAPSDRHAAQKGNRWDGGNTVLGYALQRRMILETGAEDRGLRRARFQVLKGAAYPAALVECAFLTNGREVRRLEDEAYLATLARAIALGILDFRDKTLQARLMGRFLVPDIPAYFWDPLGRRHSGVRVQEGASDPRIESRKPRNQGDLPASGPVFEPALLLPIADARDRNSVPVKIFLKIK
jgi:N-acetylmuramoyl-L-alanine amidase